MPKLKVCKIPFPYKAILSISNDPDNTTIKSWHEINNFIFNELKLNWANIVFPINKNLNLPEQVSLQEYPEIASQPTDSIHTWGDFIHSGGHGFTRNDAIQAIELLNKYKIHPKIWVDHSRFLGNLLHSKVNLGGKEFHTDASGIKYKNLEYTADLIHNLGIRYVWDGEITEIIGQDRKIKLSDIPIKKIIKGELNQSNNILNPIEFEGYKFYKFKRFGQWRNADIQGLSKILNPKFINQLLNNGGISLIYTHLGKRNPEQTNENHIPEETRNALIKVSSLVKEQKILFAPISKILDYVVLRDHIKIERDTVNFEPDGIRYKQLNPNDLSGHSFSFKTNRTKEITFYLENNQIQPHTIKRNDNIVTVSF